MGGKLHLHRLKPYWLATFPAACFPDGSCWRPADTLYLDGDRGSGTDATDMGRNAKGKAALRSNARTTRLIKDIQTIKWVTTRNFQWRGYF